MTILFPDLRLKREGKGFTRRHLAEQVGVKPGQLYRIEKGTRLPSIPTLCRLVDELGSVTIVCDAKAYLFDRHSLHTVSNSHYRQLANGRDVI